MPVEPPQYYATALFDAPTGAQLRFLIIPDRSLPEEVAPPRGAAHAASLLGLDNAREVEPDSWSLPVVFDVMTGQMPPAFAFRPSRAWRELPPLSSPSRFAQHAAFAPV